MCREPLWHYGRVKGRTARVIAGGERRDYPLQVADSHLRRGCRRTRKSKK